MTDLAAQIREQLDAQTERDYPEMQAMRDALLAVLDATQPHELPPNCCDCGGCLKLWIRHQIAVALGLEEARDA